MIIYRQSIFADNRSRKEKIKDAIDWWFDKISKGEKTWEDAEKDPEFNKYVEIGKKLGLIEEGDTVKDYYSKVSAKQKTNQANNNWYYNHNNNNNNNNTGGGSTNANNDPWEEFWKEWENFEKEYKEQQEREREFEEKRRKEQEERQRREQQRREQEEQRRRQEQQRGERFRNQEPEVDFKASHRENRVNINVKPGLLTGFAKDFIAPYAAASATSNLASQIYWNKKLEDTKKYINSKNIKPKYDYKKRLIDVNSDKGDIEAGIFSVGLGGNAGLRAGVKAAQIADLRGNSNKTIWNKGFKTAERVGALTGALEGAAISLHNSRKYGNGKKLGILLDTAKGAMVGSIGGATGSAIGFNSKIKDLLNKRGKYGKNK